MFAETLSPTNKMSIIMNRTHKHYCYPEKHTTLDNQVMVSYYINLYIT